MTVTVEELEAEGWPESKQIPQWEYRNKGMQQYMFAAHFHLTPQSLHQWWPLKEVHAFCLKFCAIYATISLGGARELYLYLWTKWFRQGVTPCRFENFVARYIGSYEPESPKSIPELLDAHRRICSQVLLRQVTLTAEDKPLKPLPHTIDDRLDNRYVNHENFHLEALFHALFIVIDTNPRRSRVLTHAERVREDTEIFTTLPVLLVRTGEFHDLRMGPIDFTAIETVSEKVDGNEHVRRVALGDAVDFVLELHRQNTELN
ncbi:MAG: hypothetical protein Q9210_003637 [Variospora velana]